MQEKNISTQQNNHQQKKKRMDKQKNQAKIQLDKKPTKCAPRSLGINRCHHKKLSLSILFLQFLARTMLTDIFIHCHGSGNTRIETLDMPPLWYCQ